MYWVKTDGSGNMQWSKIMNAEQAAVESNRSTRARALEGVVADARNDMKRFRLFPQ
jgi:hypothetical protein